MLAALYAGSACSHQQPSDKTLAIQSIYGSNHCAISEVTLKSIGSQAELQNFLKSMPKNFGMDEMLEPDIDFEKQMLILYALGNKPSSGHSLELYKSDAVLIKQKLHLPVRIKQPASGSMQAQVITSPCSIYLLPRVEYSKIVIEGSAGK
ncbi:hypothetical protein MNBD_GAMMA06-942 [hydrothermal vent metagenome]|uniref:PrcB C-terminal domain-containing protein n=1 Tax=hydrothermal vent metagenome TaxID=652676 RepID=A0A3B0WJ69_9ZZZZ